MLVRLNKKQKVLTLIVVFAGMLPAASSADVGSNWIEQWGIRWTFDKNISTNGTAGTYQYGQFANGDYWIKGPVNITEIDPPCHITVEGELDEAGRPYNSYRTTTGVGAWSVAGGFDSYRSTTIYSADTSNLTVGQVLLITGATGADSYKVNGYTAGISQIYADRFVVKWYPYRTDLIGGEDISGGVFGGMVINGSQINPLSTDRYQGYMSSAGNYRPTDNAAWPLCADNPDAVEYITVPVNSSLISTGSRVWYDSQCQTWVKRAQILTVLPSNAFDDLPEGTTPSDCFRPQYFGTGVKAILHYKTEMDDSFLGSLALIGTVPTIEATADRFARPWIRTGVGIDTRRIHPSDNMPDYYKQIATIDGARVLNSSDYTLEQKQPLLINYVQLGIDLFGHYTAGGRGSEPDGGHHQGLMLPILAFGRAFDYQPVWDMFAKAGSYRYSAKQPPLSGYYSDSDLPSDYNYIQELCQTFYVRQSDVDIVRTGGREPYTVDMIGIPEWGIRQCFRPVESDASLSASYRAQNCNYNRLEQLTVLVWGLKEKVNHNAWFDNTDRYATANPEATWTAYRKNYGPIWPNTGTTPTTYALSVSTTNGTVTKSPSKSTYTSGEVVSLTATPAAGYIFTGWSGNATGTTNPVTITMNGNKSVTANFTQNITTYALSVSADNGTVAKSPDKTSYNSGEVVTLTATTNAGYSFGGWTGSVTGTTNPVTITMNNNKAVTANFIQNPAAITELLNSALLSLLSEQTFNGIDNYKAVSTAGWNLNGTTITLWAKPNDLSVSRYLFGHNIGQSAGEWSNRIQLYIREGQLGLGLGNTNTLKQNMAAIQAGQWSFISLSFNGTSYTVQVNDKIVGTGTYTGLMQLNTFADIGNTGNPDYRSQEAFSGLIDDVRIYSKVLTAPEVLWLHNIGRNGGLAGQWEFDELKGTLAADASGNNNVGTLINSPAWGRPWAYEEYVRFDGIESKVEIPATALNANAGSIAMWVYPEDTTGVQFLFRHSRDSANNILLYSLEGSLAVGLGDRPTLKTNIAGIVAGRMYHIALTWNGSGYAVYVNGQKKDEGTYTNLTELGTTASIGNYGVLPLSTMKIGFKGIVADVQTYNRAITDAEVSNLYYTYDTKENRLLYFALGQSDSNGNPIGYSSVLNLPIGAYFTPDTQTFRWRPNYSQAGEYRITFTAQGQPSHTITVDAGDVTLKSWYKRFLVFSNKL